MPIKQIYIDGGFIYIDNFEIKKPKPKHKLERISSKADQPLHYTTNRSKK